MWSVCVVKLWCVFDVDVDVCDVCDDVGVCCELLRCVDCVCVWWCLFLVVGCVEDECVVVWVWDVVGGDVVVVLWVMYCGWCVCGCGGVMCDVWDVVWVVRVRDFCVWVIVGGEDEWGGDGDDGGASID